MAHEYNLSLIFYPQTGGGYTVICPELYGCVSEGDTLDEAAENIREIIADFLPDEVKSEVNEEVLRLGLCMKGKVFQEINVTVDDAGEVVFPAKTERVAV